VLATPRGALDAARRELDAGVGEKAAVIFDSPALASGGELVTFFLALIESA
jgi:hypothetical protein